MQAPQQNYAFGITFFLRRRGAVPDANSSAQNHGRHGGNNASQKIGDAESVIHIGTANGLTHPA